MIPPPSSATYRATALLLYAAAVAVSWFVVQQGLGTVLERYRTVAELTDLVARMEALRPDERAGQTAIPASSGDPFLAGTTQAIAGAALLQRVTLAIMRAGGTVQSSQVDLQGARSSEGFTGLTVTGEVPEPMLVSALYDLEAGMPFLFVDGLVVQAARSAGDRESAGVRVVLDVSGQWRGDR